MSTPRKKETEASYEPSPIVADSGPPVGRRRSARLSGSKPDFTADLAVASPRPRRRKTSGASSTDGEDQVLALPPRKRPYEPKVEDIPEERNDVKESKGIESNVKEVEEILVDEKEPVEVGSEAEKEKQQKESLDVENRPAAVSNEDESSSEITAVGDKAIAAIPESSERESGSSEKEKPEKQENIENFDALKMPAVKHYEDKFLEFIAEKYGEKDELCENEPAVGCETLETTIGSEKLESELNNDEEPQKQNDAELAEVQERPAEKENENYVPETPAGMLCENENASEKYQKDGQLAVETTEKEELEKQDKEILKQNSSMANDPTPFSEINKDESTPEPKLASTGQTKIKENVPPKASPSSLVNRPITIPKQKCKSGRFWKSDRDRFRSVIKTKGLKSKLEKKQKLREEMKRVKEYEKSLKEDREREKEEQRKRREENKKRRLENERKSEIVQEIKNPAKIKRMKKKQLRMIAKRDTTKVEK